MDRFDLQLTLLQKEEHWHKRKNKFYCQVTREAQNNKQKQINEALKWCKEYKKRGWAALKTGQFPLIKDPKTINRRLDGKVTNEKEREYCSVLTVDEENQIVDYVRNKNRNLQGMSRAELTTLIVHVLKVRKFGLQKFHDHGIDHGLILTPLSRYAKNVIERKSLRKSFWKRWDSKHSLLMKNRQGNVNLNRALNCTRLMAENHLDELAQELIRLGIFTNAQHLEDGTWDGDIDTSRILNHDETPLFINYGVDGSTSGFIYAAKGDECNKLLCENRECVTIEPFVTLSGSIEICHLIFKGSEITSHMAPEEAVKRIENVFISTTEHGAQDHKSLLATYKFLNKILEEKGIKKPVIILSDGHSSRFDLDIMTFLHEKEIFLFINPPDTTGVTQLLDQINHAFHDGYRKENKEQFLSHHNINRNGFVTILSKMWHTWASQDTIVNAAKRVGINSKGLNVAWMQQETFQQADDLMNYEELSSFIPNTSIIISSPGYVRSGSRDYYKHKYEQAMERLHKISDESINLNVASVINIDTVVPKESNKPTQVTQVCGSLEGTNIITILQDIKKEVKEEMYN